MPNTYFQFKQFRINQDLCAMKVCTDSCVFGAYVEVRQAKRLLDIGTGTGLLALMVAQRSEAVVEAVEINPEAQAQARQNFLESPWADRLLLHPMPLQEFAEPCTQQYDVILSNPPFFLASLKSNDAAKNTAKHTGDLLFEDILTFAQKHLTESGKLYLLLPPAEANHFAELAKTHALYLNETLEVYTRTGGKCIRHVQTYTFGPTEQAVTKTLDIREEDGKTYTEDFTALLRDYYLIF
ncbi:tRNA1(Val) (adenine(37)-N6)-methyltransferase [Pontibacter amylolyticus]|uniref:tRNA1(Val) (adenine(37)-N6)-methyltransferase n=1 Tax=Pontibacter amylolyticus TaxID=1424080 RepID=A0ABQ1WGP5_9BACT|nr:methyltransferase [Pontibacter amylolyticus]GGG28892.1 tRNA1(Val) (adenine(37)-N6)-methyltransferase [Pontibacter amylolyticus]